MIQFLYPELFLLTIPLWFAVRRWGRLGSETAWLLAVPFWLTLYGWQFVPAVSGWVLPVTVWLGMREWVRAAGVTEWLRLVIVVLLLFALSGLQWNLGGRGIDILVVADRSHSMPAKAHDNIRELIQNLERNRGTGDRIGLVTFGTEPQLEHVLQRSSQMGEFTKEVNSHGSDLNAAVLTALNLVEKERPARILVLSDGEANGEDPRSAARRARENGVPIDYRLFERLRIGDVAVSEIMLPEAVAPREPFQFSVTVYADRETSGTVRVYREGQPFATKDAELTSGLNQLLFRDVLDGGGTFNYRVELDVPDDPLLENNQGSGVVRVDAGPRVLVLNSDGVGGNLVQALQAARIPVDVLLAKSHPLTLDALDRYRAVIVENVPAEDLGRVKMEHLAQFVDDLGGGLMLTGGERSFGTGGYFKSPLDDVLPVSMELREEHRKMQVALAVVLDRSGSMAMPVKGGKTKMDLANLGTAECVRLLVPQDMVAVIAVDSFPHVVQEITRVDDPEAITSKVTRIDSGGGGIYVYVALVAAGQELMKADNYKIRHIILFSDADDSEQPGDYKKLLKEFQNSGITVSVIGLGNKSSIHAQLLEDIAKRGGGNILFTEDAQELPRLFTQDTMSIARNTFIKRSDEQPNGIPGRILPQSQLLGELGSGSFPAVNGYNLSYLKPDATAAVVSQDEFLAPWSSFWYRGLGRVSALTLEVDGRFSGGFGRWEGYEDFLITHTRWLLGGSNPNDVFVTLERAGQDALLTVELDPARNNKENAEPPQLTVVPPGVEREQAIHPEFHWIGPNTLQARFRLDSTGTYRTLVKTAQREFTRGPVVTLPYSPEYVPRTNQPDGKSLMDEMAELSGGKARADVLKVFDEPPRAPMTISLLPWLCLATICLLLVEIAGRRLSLWERAQEAVIPSLVRETVKSSRRWMPKWSLRIPKRRKASQAKPPDAGNAPQPVSTESMTDVLERAKERAKRRLK
jgi:Mg-chelatase subunit ChlD